ncbi:MAG TPA: hypothetical protein VNZ57_00255, partial [Longimicrobiales bacterium]|nr:hypothetical protein [Longimicrobiales bacterium]
LIGPGGEVWRPRERRRRRRRHRVARELERRLRHLTLPGRAAHGAPVRGYHIYDLDYGLRTGGPFEYSGRAGYPEPYGFRPPEHRWPPPPDEPEWWPRGTRTERVVGGPYARDYSRDVDYDLEYRWRRRRRPLYEEHHWSAAEPPRFRRRRASYDYW